MGVEGSMVPREGLEPSRYCYRGILNPLCLPIPPPRHGQIFRADSNLISQINLPLRKSISQLMKHLPFAL